MNSLATTITVLGLVASTAAAALSPFSISLLYQNDLDWTQDAKHSSFLFIDTLLSRQDATKACQSLGEALLPSASARQNQTDLTLLLRYTVYRGDLALNEPVWLADGTAQSTLSGLVLRVGATTGLHPALCTQSARGTTRATSLPSASNLVNITTTPTNNLYTGFRDQKSFRFLGIPYANTPARFTYPSLSSARNTHVDATAFKSVCYQSGGSGLSEDCLFLNIFTPSLPARASRQSELRPILFWIHGGGFTSGTASDATFDGGNLASRGDVVVVTINYRLSTFGWLAVPGTNITGNYGLADQITALQWVKNNIQAFGGDPSRVTIIGQSAGAASVRALMASPRTKGLFSAAVLGSNLGGYNYGTTYSEYLTPEAEYTTAGQSIVAYFNCTGPAVSECLRKVPAASLATGPSARYVIEDGHYITSPRLDVTTPGNSASVPVLIGTMADDGAAFIGYPAIGTTRAAGITNSLPGQTSLAAAVDASALFPTPLTANSTLDVFNVTARITTDVEFRCIDQATVHTAIRSGVWPHAWYYQFDRSYQLADWNPNAPVCQPPSTATHPLGDPSLPYFKCHSGELYYQFGTFGQFNLPFRDAHDLPFAQLISDYWTSFVRSHDPNPSRAYLTARGYTSTEEAVSGPAGTWKPVLKGSETLRRLDWPAIRQSGFQELEQCKLLGLPVTYYDTLKSS